MIPQAAMIARVRTLCVQHPQILAALMYGSFTRDEGDQFSDIEFYLFLQADQEWAMRQMEQYRLSQGVAINDCLIASVS